MPPLVSSRKRLGQIDLGREINSTLSREDMSTRVGKRRRIWNPVTPSISPTPDHNAPLVNDHNVASFGAGGVIVDPHIGLRGDQTMDTEMDNGESDSNPQDMFPAESHDTCNVLASTNQNMQDLTQRFLRELQNLNWQGTSQGSLHAVGNVSISQLDFSCIKSFMDADGMLRFKVTNGGGDCMQVVGRRLLLPGQTLTSHDNESIFMGLAVTFSYGCPKRIAYPSESHAQDQRERYSCGVSNMLALPAPVMSPSLQEPMGAHAMMDASNMNEEPCAAVHLPERRRQKRMFDAVSEAVGMGYGEDACPISSNMDQWRIHASTAADTNIDRIKRRRVQPGQPQFSQQSFWNTEASQSAWR
eukprot:m.691329 g.691329  ORF g.691329 m.691329 type:complete len:358 (-) comp22854_c0_seq7:1799-2872(-)